MRRRKKKNSFFELGIDPPPHLVFFVATEVFFSPFFFRSPNINFGLPEGGLLGRRQVSFFLSPSFLSFLDLAGGDGFERSKERQQRKKTFADERQSKQKSFFSLSPNTLGRDGRTPQVATRIFFPRGRRRVGEEKEEDHNAARRSHNGLIPLPLPALTSSSDRPKKTSVFYCCAIA